MSEKPRPAFPAPALPEQPADQKLLGVYQQRQDGFMLQRIRIPGGRLTLDQWLAIADAAEQVGARDALHLTTRQCLEVHGLTAATVPVLQALLAEAGLSTVGAAGDTVRNFTVDPEGGLLPGTHDLMPLAEAMTAAVEALPGIWSLPRKFKVSLSGSERARMRPWMSDVGIIAAADGSLTAIVAGSLGAKPGTGMLFRRGLTCREAVAVVTAAVRLHELEGDRENRRTARLRHVRERMGDVVFLEKLGELFEDEVAEKRTVPDLSAPPRTAPSHIRLSVPHGDLPIAELRAVVAASAEGGEIRIGLEHELHVFGVALDNLPSDVRPWSTGGRLVACPGTALCPKAAAPTHGAADALASIAAGHPDLLFAISGCPNSCAHAAVADIGLTGRMRRLDDERVAVYSVYSGGDAGAGPALAVLVAENVALDDLSDVVRSLLGE